MPPRATHTALVLLLLLSASAGTARAQNWAVSARASGTTGASDNILNTDDSATAGMAGPISDLFYQVQPSLVGDYEAPRTRHRLTYVFDAFFYQQNSEANTTSHYASWLTRWLVSPRSELQVEASADAGQVSTFLSETQPQAANVALVPRGDLNFRRVSMVERFRWRATPTLRLSQEYAMRASSTNIAGEQQTSGKEIVATAGADKQWKRDSLGVEVAASLVDLRQLATIAVPMSQTQTDINLATMTRWRRTLSPGWSSMLGAGVAVTSVDTPRASERLRPIADAELVYTRDWGGAALTYTRVVEPNLFVAQETVSDSLGLRGRLPLPWLRRRPDVATLALASSASVQRGTGFEMDTGDTIGSWTTYMFDVQFTWAAADNLQVGVRYQFADQNGDSSLVPSYTRNTGMVTVSGELGRRRRVRHQLRTQATEQSAESADSFLTGN